MRPTPDDHAKARRLLMWAPAREAIVDDGLAADSYHHDHDEELGMYWYGNPAASRDRSRPRHSDLAYWAETGSLVTEYLMLQAGARYSDSLRQGFIAWLQGGSAERRAYVAGDDMQRAALADWYLKLVS